MNGLPSWSFAGMKRRREGRVGGVRRSACACLGKGGGGGIRSLEVGQLCRTYSTVEDMDRASQGNLSLQGKTSLGLSVPVKGSDYNCSRT